VSNLFEKETSSNWSSPVFTENSNSNGKEIWNALPYQGIIRARLESSLRIEPNNMLYRQEDILMVSDPVALQHIMNNHSFVRAATHHSFVRAATQRQKGKLIFGERSVYCAEGQTPRWLVMIDISRLGTGNGHRRFRAALNTGFAPTLIRSFQPIFADAAQRVLVLCLPSLSY
jgi:cytochrome P450